MHSVYKIMNLRCGGCANTITTKIGALEGVERVEVKVDESEVWIDHLENMNSQTIVNRLQQLGYPLEGNENGVVTKAKGLKSCMIGKLS